jgi:hypothetical protein
MAAKFTFSAEGPKVEARVIELENRSTANESNAVCLDSTVTVQVVLLWSRSKLHSPRIREVLSRFQSSLRVMGKRLLPAWCSPTVYDKEP